MAPKIKRDSVMSMFKYAGKDADLEFGSKHYAAGSDRMGAGESMVLSGSFKLTAEEGNLATDEPKFARMMKASFARRRSADLAMWDKYTEPKYLPHNVVAQPSEKANPYQAEVVPSGGRRSRSVFGLPMVRPESPAAWRWKTLIVAVDVTYTAFLVPLSFAFFHDVRVFNWMTIFDILGGFVYVVDVIMNFHIGIVLTRSMQARLVLDGSMVARLYVRRSTFVLDLIASLPVWPEVILVALNPGDSLKVLAEITTWIRLTRMFRLFPLLQSLSVLSLTGYHNRRMLRMMPSSVLLLGHVTFMFLFIANFLSNLWAYVAIAEGPENSWMRNVGSADDDISNSSGVTKYLSSLYYVVTTLATVGYGDISASTNAERVIAIIIMIIGVAFFGFLLAVLQNIIQRGSSEGRRADMFRDKITNVEAWMHYSDMPNGLRNEIRAFYAEVYIRHREVDEEEMFNALPYHLRGRVTSYLLDDMLKESDAFGSLDRSGRLLVAAMLKPVPVAPGHDLFTQCTAANSVYILQDGELAMYRNTIEIARLGAPFLTGQLAVLNACEPDGESPHKHLFACRAVSLCMVWELSMDDLLPLMNVRMGLKESLLRSLRTMMERWGTQQPEETCWAEAAAQASYFLQKVKDSNSLQSPDDTQMQQERKMEEDHEQPGSAERSPGHSHHKHAMKPIEILR